MDDQRRKIKPFETVCPECGHEQVTEELNLSYYGTANNAFAQSHIECNKCKYKYSWNNHKNPEYKLELRQIKIVEES